MKTPLATVGRMKSEQFRLNVMLAIHRAQAEGFTAFAAALAEMLRRDGTIRSWRDVR